MLSEQQHCSTKSQHKLSLSIKARSDSHTGEITTRPKLAHPCLIQNKIPFVTSYCGMPSVSAAEDTGRLSARLYYYLYLNINEMFIELSSLTKQHYRVLFWDGNKINR